MEDETTCVLTSSTHVSGPTPLVLSMLIPVYEDVTDLSTLLTAGVTIADIEASKASQNFPDPQE